MRSIWIQKNVRCSLQIRAHDNILISYFIGRRRALDRAMDAALKNPTKRRRRADGIVRLPYAVPDYM